MLDSLQLDIDDTKDKMISVDNRLKDIVANTNQCKMWIIIFIEILILLFIIFI